MGRKALAKERQLNPKVRQEWLKKLIPFFMERGFSSTKMEDIARYLGVSKATLYEHFSGQDELYSLALDYVLGEIHASRAILKETELTHPERYIYLFGVVLQQVTGITAIFLEDIEKNFPKLWEKVQDFYQSWEKDLEDFYQEGVKAGQFIDIHPAVFSRMITGMLREMITSDFLQQHRLSLSQVFLDFFRVHAQGVFSGSFEMHHFESLAKGVIRKTLEKISTN